MILRKLHVRNIRSYVSGDLELEDGITALSGEIGSGKTSLLHALEMALFGFTEVPPVHLLRHGTSEGEVEILFDDNGSSVGLRRTIQRRHSKGEEVSPEQRCSLARDGSRAAYSTTELKKEVIKLMGFPDDPNPRSHSDLWRWAVYVPQESMREVLSQGGDQRLETIRRAHGLEEYRTARDNAADLASALRAKAREYDSAANEHAGAEVEWEELSRKLEESKPRLERLKADVDRTRQALAEAEARLNERNRLQTDLAVAHAGLATRKAQLETLRNNLQRGRKRADALTETIVRENSAAEEVERQLSTESFSPHDLEEQETRMREATKRLESATKEMGELTAARARVKAAEMALAEVGARAQKALDSLEVRVREVEKRTKEMETSPRPGPEPRPLAAIEQGIQRLRSELDRLTEDIGQSKHSETEIGELIHSGKCPRCGQAVDAAAFATHLEEASARRTGLERAKAEKEGALESLEAERKHRLQYDRAVADWQRRNELLAQATKEAATAETVRNDTEELREVKQENLQAVVTEATSLAHAEVSQREASAATKREQTVLDGLRQEKHKIDVLKVRLESALHARTKGERDLASAREEISTLEDSIKDLGREMQGEESRVLDLSGSLGPYAGTEEKKVLAGREAALASTTLTSAEGEVSHLERDRERARKALEKRKEAGEHAARSRSLADWLGRFGLATEEMEKRRLERIHHDFAREFSRYFTILVDDNSMAATVDTSFAPSVHTGSFETPPDALSGGERTALALAYRLALGYTVRSANKLRLESLILDEPTDGFSNAQVTKLSELLRAAGHRQILLVSHDKNLVGVADRVIRVEKKDGLSTLN